MEQIRYCIQCAEWFDASRGKEVKTQEKPNSQAFLCNHCFKEMFPKEKESVKITEENVGKIKILKWVIFIREDSFRTGGDFDDAIERVIEDLEEEFPEAKKIHADY